MEYIKLGTSGLEVSRICLGCMGFGDSKKWIHSWVLQEQESRKIIKYALDQGINFFDTANVYSLGVSEEVLGLALTEYASRDEVVVATKVHGRMHEGANGAGLSRKAILSEVNHSLERLGMDYIDLLIIHRFDASTPLEETMETLHDLIKSGKVRYIGASSMYAWQFQKAQNIAKQHGWTMFISMQNHYNLLYREEEREMIPYCIDQNIALTPYSPLAAGRLARDWNANSKRAMEDTIAKSKYDTTKLQDEIIVKRVGEVALRLNVSRSQVALAWLLSKPQVVAPIVGVTKIEYLEDAIKALDLKLSSEDVAYLEDAYLPHKMMGPIES